VGIPYVFYAAFLPDCTKKWRYFCYITLILMLLGVVLSSSRGGFLGVIAVFGAMWWLSVKRGKIAMAGCLIGIVAGSVLLSLLPPAYLADMESINDKEDGTRIERFHTWEIGWEMFKDKPIFGVGAGSFANTSHLYEAKTSWYTGHEKSLSGRAAHSLYFQVIPELGIIGICIFAYILFYLPLSLIGRARSLSYENKEERLKKIYLNILITSMAGYVIAGAFISVAYYPHMPMWLIMFSIYKYMDRNTENLLTSKEK
jgi:O-antigen ligase